MGQGWKDGSGLKIRLFIYSDENQNYIESLCPSQASNFISRAIIEEK
jgi:hypothetical protein